MSELANTNSPFENNIRKETNSSQQAVLTNGDTITPNITRTKRGRGRPPGSKSKHPPSSDETFGEREKKKSRGRPVGSGFLLSFFLGIKSQSLPQDRNLSMASTLLSSPELLDSFLKGEKAIQFNSKNDIKRFIIDWSISIGKAFKVIKSSQRRYEIGCPWQAAQAATISSEEKEKIDDNLIYLSEDYIMEHSSASTSKECGFKFSMNYSSKANGWHVRTYHPHTCPSVNKLKKVPVHWILEKFKSLYKPKDHVEEGSSPATPTTTLSKELVETFTPSTIQSAILESFGIELPYPSAWKALSLLQHEYGIDVHAFSHSIDEPTEGPVKKKPGRPKKSNKPLPKKKPIEYDSFLHIPPPSPSYMTSQAGIYSTSTGHYSATPGINPPFYNQVYPNGPSTAYNFQEFNAYGHNQFPTAPDHIDREPH